MNDWVLAQVLGDAFEHLATSARVAEFVRVAADRVVIMRLALLEGIPDIVLGQGDSVAAGSAADLLLLGAGGKLAHVVAGDREGRGVSDTLFLVLVVFVLVVFVLVVLFLVSVVPLSVRGTCAGFISASNCSPGMLHNTPEVPSIVLVVSDNAIFARRSYFRAVC